MSHPEDTIALIGFTQREQNLLEVFFAGSDAQGLALQNPDRATALLINLDTEASLRSFRRWAADKDEQRPVIGVVDTPEVPDGVIALPRPLTLTALKQALQTLRTELKRRRSKAGSRPGLDQDPVLARYLKPAAVPSVDHETFRAVVAEARLASAQPVPVAAAVSEPPRKVRGLLDWPENLRHELEQQSCGSLPDLDLSCESSRRRLEFSLRGSFLEVMQEAVNRARERGHAMQVLGVPGVLLYFPAVDRVSYDLDPELLLQMTRARFGPEELRVCDRPDQHTPRSPGVPRDEFMWFVALMTARGRLPAGTDVERPMQLQRRPAFPRFLRLPDGNRIAELWCSSPHSALEVAQALSVPHRRVFSFLVAADAAGLFTEREFMRTELRRESFEIKGAGHAR